MGRADGRWRTAGRRWKRREKAITEIRSKKRGKIRGIRTACALLPALILLVGFRAAYILPESVRAETPERKSGVQEGETACGGTETGSGIPEQGEETGSDAESTGAEILREASGRIIYQDGSIRQTGPGGSRAGADGGGYDYSVTGLRKDLSGDYGEVKTGVRIQAGPGRQVSLSEGAGWTDVLIFKEEEAASGHVFYIRSSGTEAQDYGRKKATVVFEVRKSAEKSESENQTGESGKGEAEFYFEGSDQAGDKSGEKKNQGEQGSGGNDRERQSGDLPVSDENRTAGETGTDIRGTKTDNAESMEGGKDARESASEGSGKDVSAGSPSASSKVHSGGGTASEAASGETYIHVFGIPGNTGADKTLQPMIYVKDPDLESVEVGLFRRQVPQGSGKAAVKDTDVTARFFPESLRSGGRGKGYFRAASSRFEKIQENDGVYLLRVRTTDTKGNSRQEEMTFTVNHFGSIFFYNRKWTTADHRYLREMKEPLVVTELNPDRIKSGIPEITRDGEILLNPAFRVETGGSLPENALTEAKMKEYYMCRYVLQPENFEKDGLYRVGIASADASGNHQKTFSEGFLTFAIDSTKPEIEEIEKLRSYRVYDAIGLDALEVFLKSDSGKQMKLESRKSFSDAGFYEEKLDADAVAKAARKLKQAGENAVSGKSGDSKTAGGKKAEGIKLILRAEDLAGNRTEFIRLLDDGEKEAGKSISDFVNPEEKAAKAGGEGREGGNDMFVVVLPAAAALVTGSFFRIFVRKKRDSARAIDKDFDSLL